MTQEDIQALVVKWQAIMRLQDWDVDIRFSRAHDIGPDRDAEVDRCDSGKCARISIKDPGDRDSKCISPQDIELSLVHEMVHLYFPHIDNFNGTDDAIYEQAVHQISSTMVKLERARTAA
jgi:hypothetical protein